MAQVVKEGKEVKTIAENNKKKVDNLDERVGYIKEKLNDLASILGDIRDELEIKVCVTRGLSSYQVELQFHMCNELKINLPSMELSEYMINKLINNNKEEREKSRERFINKMNEQSTFGCNNNNNRNNNNTNSQSTKQAQKLVIIR